MDDPKQKLTRAVVRINSHNSNIHNNTIHIAKHWNHTARA